MSAATYRKSVKFVRRPSLLLWCRPHRIYLYRATGKVLEAAKQKWREVKISDSWTRTWSDFHVISWRVLHARKLHLLTDDRGNEKCLRLTWKVRSVFWNISLHLHTQTDWSPVIKKTLLFPDFSRPNGNHVYLKESVQVGFSFVSFTLYCSPLGSTKWIGLPLTFTSPFPLLQWATAVAVFCWKCRR